MRFDQFLLQLWFLHFLPSFCNISRAAQFKRILPCWEYNMLEKKKNLFSLQNFFFKNSKHVWYNCTTKNICKKIINHWTIFYFQFSLRERDLCSLLLPTNLHYSTIPVLNCIFNLVHTKHNDMLDLRKQTNSKFIE